MSIPIRYCKVASAANGNERSYKHVLEAMEYNLRCLAWSVFPCRCETPCTTTDELMKQFNDRLNEDLKARRGP